MLAQNELSTESLEEQLKEITHTLYDKSARQIVPMFPFVLLRILNKAQVYKGLLHLPEHEQNKTVHEGVVLATWRPRRIEKAKIYRDERGEFIRTVIQSSAFEPGDHVLIPHWVGIPAYGLDPQRYRMVKECDWDITKDGGILARVTYDEPDQAPFQKLLTILGNDSEGTLLARKIEDAFLLVDRSKPGVTISGK